MSEHILPGAVARPGISTISQAAANSPASPINIQQITNSADTPASFKVTLPSYLTRPFKVARLKQEIQAQFDGKIIIHGVHGEMLDRVISIVRQGVSLASVMPQHITWKNRKNSIEFLQQIMMALSDSTISPDIYQITVNDVIGNLKHQKDGFFSDEMCDLISQFVQRRASCKDESSDFKQFSEERDAFREKYQGAMERHIEKVLASIPEPLPVNHSGCNNLMSDDVKTPGKLKRNFSAELAVKELTEMHDELVVLNRDFELLPDTILHHPELREQGVKTLQRIDALLFSIRLYLLCCVDQIINVDQSVRRSNIEKNFYLRVERKYVDYGITICIPRIMNGSFLRVNEKEYDLAGLLKLAKLPDYLFETMQAIDATLKEIYFPFE